MEIEISVNQNSSVKLSYIHSSQYEYSQAEILQKVKLDLVLLERMLTIQNLNLVDKTVLKYLYDKAKNFNNDWKIAYLIFKYTDVYQKKLIPCWIT